jgi:outer membrane protein
MQQRIQNYQQTAQAQLNQKQTELLKPVFDKAEKTIEEVAKEKGLLYVFDIGSKVVLYKSNESLDVLPLVKTKLGI